MKNNTNKIQYFCFRKKQNKPKRMNESLFSTVVQTIKAVMTDIHALLTGIAVSIMGYFLPVKNIVHLLIFFFVLDVIFGFWAARKLRKERFSVKIIWSHTIPRMLISLVLIIGAYMWDSVYSQDFVCTYKLIGWFISGVLLYSIADNGYQITKWSVFPKIGGIFKRNIEEKTGETIDKESK